MTRTIALLLLLLQLKPLAGMAVCVHQAAAAPAECPMGPPPDVQGDDGSDVTAPRPDTPDYACPFADLCAPSAPALIAVAAAARFEGRLVAASPAPIASACPADPAGPPVPPPNA